MKSGQKSGSAGKSKRNKQAKQAPTARNNAGQEPANRRNSWNDRQARDDRRDYKKRERKENADRRDHESTALSSLNDFSWYNRYPILTAGVGRQAFPYRPGMAIPAISFDVSTPYSVPGVMAVYWAPSAGWSRTTDSPISTVAREVWAKVRREFSSTIEVDPPDFIPYIMALDSLYSFIGALSRCYKLLDWYSANNHVTPDGLLTAMGCNNTLIQSMRDNKADFNLAINLLIKQVLKFTLPFDMDIVSRHFWLNSNVYTDAATINSQFYLFHQVLYYKYGTAPVGEDGKGTDSATACTYISAPWYSARKYSDLINFGYTLLTALNESDDAYTMNGYLLRAYGLRSGITLDDLPITSEFEAAYVPEVLAQIENCQPIMSHYDGWDTNPLLLQDGGIWQDPTTNTVFCKPYVTTSGLDLLTNPALGSDQVAFSIRSDEPTIEDVIVASRLKSQLRLATSADNLGVEGYPVIAGTEITISINIWTRQKANALVTWSQTSYPGRAVLSLATDAAPTNTQQLSIKAFATLAYAGAFDWRPIATLMVNSAVTGTYIPFGCKTIISGDVHNLTAINTYDLEKMHEVCVFSEFNAFSISE